MHNLPNEVPVETLKLQQPVGIVLLLPLIQDPDLTKRIEEARSRIYSAFIISECLIGEHVSTDKLDGITKREIAANRMSNDHSLRHFADMSTAFPQLTEKELLDITENKRALGRKKYENVEKVVEGVSFLSKVRSVLRFFGI